MGAGVEGAHARDDVPDQPGRGVHRQVERDQAGLADGHLVERLDREVEAAHRKAFTLEPCRR